MIIEESGLVAETLFDRSPGPDSVPGLLHGEGRSHGKVIKAIADEKEEDYERADQQSNDHG